MSSQCGIQICFTVGKGGFKLFNFSFRLSAHFFDYKTHIFIKFIFQRVLAKQI